jgi:hypothetical protein
MPKKLRLGSIFHLGQFLSEAGLDKGKIYKLLAGDMARPAAISANIRDGGFGETEVAKEFIGFSQSLMMIVK